MAQHQILIVGGGAAGLTVASQLQRARPELQITILEPSSHHDYQPGWTLVGAGVFSLDETRRDEAGLIPPGVTWIREAAAGFDPTAAVVHTSTGRRLGYDVLIVATGIRLCWERVRGLPEALGSQGITSNYRRDLLPYTWKTIQEFSGGNALFTFPQTPIKCAGAPQKIMYLADDAFRKQGVRDKSRVIYVSPQKQIFAIERYRKPLEEVIARKGLEMQFQHELTSVDGPNRKATIVDKQTGQAAEMSFDMMHVTPPMGPPEAVAASDIADAHGWADVDKYTLQSTKFANVFAAGDCINAPCAKTGAAVRKQAPVVVANLAARMRSKGPAAKYDGYGSCPLVTGYGSLILAEFGYDGAIQESFPIDQSKERWSMYMLKRHLLPQLYWHGMLRGRA